MVSFISVLIYGDEVSFGAEDWERIRKLRIITDSFQVYHVRSFFSSGKMKTFCGNESHQYNNE